MRLPILALSLVLPAAAAEIPKAIPKGSHALLRLVNSVSTRTAREGDFVYFRTASPVVSEGSIVVPVDSYVQGVVSHARRSGRVAGSAELAIRIETLTLPSGKVVKVAPTLNSVDSEGSDQKVVGKENELKQGTSHGSDAVRIASTGGMGAAIGGMADRSWKGAGIGAGAGSAVGLASVLLTRGREVELRQGSTIDVVFDRTVAVE
jgi:hypothetical protein